MKLQYLEKKIKEATYSLTSVNCMTLKSVFLGNILIHMFAWFIKSKHLSQKPNEPGLFRGIVSGANLAHMILRGAGKL